MSDDHRPQQAQQQQPPQQQKSGGPPSRTTRKSLADSSNLAAGFLWAVSAVLSGIAAANLFIPVPPTCRAEDFMIIPSCADQVVNAGVAWLVASGALILQFLITVVRRRVRNPQWQKWTNRVEHSINFFGIYWVVCVAMGFVPELRTIVASIVNLGVGAIFALIAMIAVSILWDYAIDALLDAPPQQAQQPPRK